MAEVRLERVTKVYPGGHRAVAGVDLAVHDGELLVVVGPSGCGKSTLLRLVAGLEFPTEGRVFVGGEDVTELPPQKRDVAMVFQNYALYPHKTVRENLAFPLRVRGVARDQIDRRVWQVAQMLGLSALLDRRPAQLSGGQRQRVALGRAIVRRPKAFLLDEPLSNLDARLRVETRAELARIRRRLGVTMLYVTHDQEEAMTLGDRIAVMNEGRFEQVAPPLEIYRRPGTLYVARFVGSPSMNVYPAHALAGAEKVAVDTGFFRVFLPRPKVSGRLLLGIRPEDVKLVAAGERDAVGVVEIVQPLGASDVVHLALEGPGESKMTAVCPAEEAPRPGDRVGLRFPPDRVHLFDAETGLRIPDA
ncbi:MAG: ABC transporter ATP-binding protein [Candidatus Binatia bacterium]|nr:MAG: ABC transporter ATP-binding protein [Candidatus Binatia bacterium]